MRLRLPKGLYPVPWAFPFLNLSSAQAMDDDRIPYDLEECIEEAWFDIDVIGGSSPDADFEMESATFVDLDMLMFLEDEQVSDVLDRAESLAIYYYEYGEDARESRF